MIDGDLAYGSETRMRKLADPDRQDGLELQIAWGKRMLLDTSYQAHPGPEAVPKLSELRAELIEHYKPIGPIFA